MEEEEEQEQEQPSTKEDIKCPQEEAAEPNWNFQAEVGFCFSMCFCMRCILIQIMEL